MRSTHHRVLGASLAALAAAGASLGVLVSTAAGERAAVSTTAGRAAVATTAGERLAVRPPRVIRAHRLTAPRGAVRPGTVVSSRQLVSDRVFANARDGFALASVRSAQYPARTVDGGRVWRIDGPPLHVNGANAPAVVDSVGVDGSRTAFFYGGGQAVDVTTDAGRVWWQAFIGELVVAVVRGPRRQLVTYAQQQVRRGRSYATQTWQYVSGDGGRVWRYSTALGG